MKEKYDELKMEVIAFEEGVWIATIDAANPASTGSGRQGGQNALIDPTGTAGNAP